MNARLPDSRMLAALLTAAGMLLAAEGVRAEDWPWYRGPNHDGTTRERITAAWPLRELWSTNVGAGYAETVVSGGRLYTWGWNNGASHVYCLNPATGARIWYRSNPFNPVGNHQAQCATLAVSDGKVYAMDRESTLYCYDAIEGTELWRRDISQELGFQCFQTERGESSSPVIEGYLILFCFGSGGAALDGDTGAKVWCHGTGGASFASAYVYTSGQDRIAAFMTGGGVGVNVRTGEIVWSFPAPANAGFSCTDLIVAGDKVLYSCGYYNGPVSLAYTLGTGALSMAWNTGVLGARCTPNVLYDGYVYGTDGCSYELVCMDSQTGEQKWRQGATRTSSFDEYTGTIVAGGRLVVVTHGVNTPGYGTLILADASPAGYREIHSQTSAVPDEGVANVFRPSIADGKLYVRNCGGRVVCFDARGPAAVPVITTPATATGNVGTAFTYQIATLDDPTGFGASGLPAGLSVDKATGLISGTPTTAGVATVTLTATNAAGSGRKTLTLTVNAAPAPVITSAPSAWAAVGIPFSYGIAASDAKNFGATGLPAELSVNPSSGAITGTPATPGTHEVVLSATGPGGTSSANLALTVGQAVFVDGKWPKAGTGTRSDPFNTIKAGVDAANANSGWTVVVAAGCTSHWRTEARRTSARTGSR